MRPGWGQSFAAHVEGIGYGTLSGIPSVGSAVLGVVGIEAGETIHSFIAAGLKWNRIDEPASGSRWVQLKVAYRKYGTIRGI